MTCLNCGTEADNKFCPSCGQKTSTHRFSLKGFFSHDLLHGILHLDAAFPRTIKDLILNAGDGVREFIQGKRMHYFNFATLLIILIGFDHFIEQYALVSVKEFVSESMGEDTDKGKLKIVTVVVSLLNEYPKALIFAQIPFFAFASWKVFKKAGQNYAEHLVLTSYKTAGVVLTGYVLLISKLLIQDVKLLILMDGFTTLLTTLYTFWFCYRYFKPFYDKKWVLIRKGVFYTIYEFLLQFLVGVIAASIYLFVNGGLVK